MLSTSIAASQTTLPKLASDGSNWIVWKTHIQILIGVKKLAHLLDDKVTHPTKLELFTGTPNATDTAAYETTIEKFQEFDQSDVEVKHFIMSTILDTLLIKTINCATASSLWKAICTEHKMKTKWFAVEMLCNLQNQCCSETDDIQQHFGRMVKLQEELAATRKVIDDIDFTSIITNSLPPSYDHVVSSAYSAAITVDKEINTDQIITVAWQEEFSCRQISSGNSHPTSTALFTNPQKQSSLK